MDEKKIAFIICVNDEEEFSECRYYLERLFVPEGYHTDIISIRGASSMTAGYNAGMKSSDAKYKVYLHQDVFITNRELIQNMLDTFACDEQIGLLGVIGNKDWGMQVTDLTDWDVGSIKDNYMYWDRPVPDRDAFAEVQALDGLLLATQFDIPWREDIFDGWHFYDISQCMEFKKAGYKVVVPRQEKAWCYHDNLYADVSVYYDYYERFILEYGKWAGIVFGAERPGYEVEREYAQMVKMMQDGIDRLISAGAKTELRKLINDPNIQGRRGLKEQETIVLIDGQEEQKGGGIHFWEAGLSAQQLLGKLRKLKHTLKRIECGIEGQEREIIRTAYSKYAVRIVCERYFIEKEKIDVDRSDGADGSTMTIKEIYHEKDQRYHTML